MASGPLFTLSRKGLLRGVGERISQIFAYYLASNLSQSDLYIGIRSLQGTIQHYNNDASKLQAGISDDLSALFGANFDDVSVTVTIQDTSSFDQSNRMTITIDVIVWEGQVPYSVGQVLETVNGIVQTMINTNNTGTA